MIKLKVFIISKRHHVKLYCSRAFILKGNVLSIETRNGSNTRLDGIVCRDVNMDFWWFFLVFLVRFTVWLWLMTNRGCLVLCLCQTSWIISCWNNLVSLFRCYLLTWFMHILGENLSIEMHCKTKDNECFNCCNWIIW